MILAPRAPKSGRIRSIPEPRVSSVSSQVPDQTILAAYWQWPRRKPLSIFARDRSVYPGYLSRQMDGFTSEGTCILAAERLRRRLIGQLS